MRQLMSADELSNDCQGAERAALLAELGELRLLEGRPDEANKLFQEAFDLQYKGSGKLPGAGSGKAAAAAPAKTPSHSETAAAAAAAQATPAPDTPAAAAPAPADASPVARPAASPGADSDSSASGGWDDSDDDWEPDVTQFKPARAATTGGLPPAAHASSSSSSSAAARAGQCQTEPGAGRWQSRSWGGASPARAVRGRGESKCGLGSESDDEPELRANAASLPHIVEVYGLHRGVRSSQLEEFLAEFAWGGLGAALRWVDDAHALAVFPCAEAAQALLASPQRSYKVRPYSQASSGSLQVDVEDLAPPRGARPKTTTAVARRLISNALGNREVRDRAAEKELADLRRANKQERQMRQQGMAAAWGEDD